MIGLVLISCFGFEISSADVRSENEFYNQNSTMRNFLTENSGVPISEQWPFVAAVFRIENDKIKFACGGTLISIRSVITGNYNLSSIALL